MKNNISLDAIELIGSKIKKIIIFLIIILSTCFCISQQLNQLPPQTIHPHQIILQVKNGAEKAAHDKLFTSHGLRKNYTSTSVPGMYILTITNLNDKSISNKVEKLRASKLFEYVEYDTICHLQEMPKEKTFTNGQLWHLMNKGTNGGIAGVDIGATNAWNLTTGNSNIIIAIIDTGIRYTHKDITNNMWINQKEIKGNGIDDDKNGYIDDIYGINTSTTATTNRDCIDDNGHGTEIAGMIGASWNDAYTAGIMKNVKLMSCKFLDAGGMGYVSGFVKCMDYAIVNKAKIINTSFDMGLNTSTDSNSMYRIISVASSNGILLTAAAGNYSISIDKNPIYPASFKLTNIITVASIGSKGALSSWSGYGIKTVHLAAPGEGILVPTIWKILKMKPFTITNSDVEIIGVSGTSFSSPCVAGVAGLIWSKYPNLTMQQVRQSILKSTVPSLSLNSAVASGGYVNAYMALLYAGNTNNFK